MEFVEIPPSLEQAWYSYFAIQWQEERLRGNYRSLEFFVNRDRIKVGGMGNPLRVQVPTFPHWKLKREMSSQCLNEWAPHLSSFPHLPKKGTAHRKGSLHLGARSAWSSFHRSYQFLAMQYWEGEGERERTRLLHNPKDWSNNALWIFHRLWSAWWCLLPSDQCKSISCSNNWISASCIAIHLEILVQLF